MTEATVARVLYEQVATAAKGNDHHRVTTVVTRAMWQVFLRAYGLPENAEPVQSANCHQARSVAGSLTFVLDVPGMWAVSRLTL